MVPFLSILLGFIINDGYSTCEFTIMEKMGRRRERSITMIIMIIAIVSFMVRRTI